MDLTLPGRWDHRKLFDADFGCVQKIEFWPPNSSALLVSTVVCVDGEAAAPAVEADVAPVVVFAGKAVGLSFDSVPRPCTATDVCGMACCRNCLVEMKDRNVFESASPPAGCFAPPVR